MKYQITCGNCGKRFLVDAKGGQTIECKCPECDGVMRVQIPKSEKNDSADGNADDGYQRGYVPEQDGIPADGTTGNDGGVKRHRALALGCLLVVVAVAAAVVAFLALNRTTKKPIEDPYEYFTPDTATVDSLPEDTEEEVVVDTVQVHETKPQTEVTADDSTAVDEDAEASDVAGEPTVNDVSTTTENQKPETSTTDNTKKDKKDRKDVKKDKGVKPSGNAQSADAPAKE